MAYSPDSDFDPSDLNRAAVYGAWAARFQNGGAPDGLSDFGAWGHVARWLAQKGSSGPARLPIRQFGVMAPNLLTQALLHEPGKRLGWPTTPTFTLGPLGDNSRGGHQTLRGMLLWGINRSEDKLVEEWSSNGVQLAQTVARAVESDPDPLVRLEALKLLSTASFPVQRWASATLPAIERAQAILAETAYDTTTRRVLQKALLDAKSRLLTLLATEGLPLLPGGDRLAPPVKSFPWKLVLGLAAGAGAAGFGVYAYRRRTGRRRRLNGGRVWWAA